jgi:hypothetical protein
MAQPLSTQYYPLNSSMSIDKSGVHRIDLPEEVENLVTIMTGCAGDRDRNLETRVPMDYVADAMCKQVREIENDPKTYVAMEILGDYRYNNGCENPENWADDVDSHFRSYLSTQNTQVRVINGNHEVGAHGHHAKSVEGMIQASQKGPAAIAAFNRKANLVQDRAAREHYLVKDARGQTAFKLFMPERYYADFIYQKGTLVQVVFHIDANVLIDEPEQLEWLTNLNLWLYKNHPDLKPAQKVIATHQTPTTTFDRRALSKEDKKYCVSDKNKGHKGNLHQYLTTALTRCHLDISDFTTWSAHEHEAMLAINNVIYEPLKALLPNKTKVSGNGGARSNKKSKRKTTYPGMLQNFAGFGFDQTSFNLKTKCSEDIYFNVAVPKTKSAGPSEPAHQHFDTEGQPFAPGKDVAANIEAGLAIPKLPPRYIEKQKTWYRAVRSSFKTGSLFIVGMKMKEALWLCKNDIKPGDRPRLSDKIKERQQVLDNMMSKLKIKKPADYTQVDIEALQIEIEKILYIYLQPENFMQCTKFYDQMSLLHLIVAQMNQRFKVQNYLIDRQQSLAPDAPLQQRPHLRGVATEVLKAIESNFDKKYEAFTFERGDAVSDDENDGADDAELEFAPPKESDVEEAVEQSYRPENTTLGQNQLSVSEHYTQADLQTAIKETLDADNIELYRSALLQYLKEIGKSYQAALHDNKHKLYYKVAAVILTIQLLPTSSNPLALLASLFSAGGSFLSRCREFVASAMTQHIKQLLHWELYLTDTINELRPGEEARGKLFTDLPKKTQDAFQERASEDLSIAILKSETAVENHDVSWMFAPNYIRANVDPAALNCLYEANGQNGQAFLEDRILLAMKQLEIAYNTKPSNHLASCFKPTQSNDLPQDQQQNILHAAFRALLNAPSNPTRKALQNTLSQVSILSQHFAFGFQAGQFHCTLLQPNQDAPMLPALQNLFNTILNLDCRGLVPDFDPHILNARLKRALRGKTPEEARPIKAAFHQKEQDAHLAVSSLSMNIINPILARLDNHQLVMDVSNSIVLRTPETGRLTTTVTMEMQEVLVVEGGAPNTQESGAGARQQFLRK